MRDGTWQSGPALLSGLDILFVDDVADERELFKVRFGRYGAKIRSVDSADAALDALAERVPDLLASDIGMSQRSGLDLIRSVRALDPARGGLVPAVAISGFARASERQEALAHGFDGHISKPYDETAFIESVAEIHPLIRQLRERRAELVSQRAELAVMRQRLARQRAEIAAQREWLASSERTGEAVRDRLSAIIAARRYVECVALGSVIEEVSPGTPIRCDDGGQMWLVLTRTKERTYYVEVTIGKDLSVEAKEFELR